MGHIYKITNILNNKCYIGQTKRNPLVRWSEHIRYAKTNIKGKSKLYNAIQKYGIECFLFTLIEELNNKDLDIKESFWIKYYNSSMNGYNILNKSRGKRNIDISDEKIIRLYLQNQSIEETSRLLVINFGTVRSVLRNNNISIKRRKLIVKNRTTFKSPVSCYTISGDFIRTFNTIKEAIIYFELPIKASGHISKCCQKIRPTAYGFIWHYKHEVETHSVST